MPSKVPLRGLRIDDELYEKICLLGKMNERSFNQEATFVLKQFVAEFEKKNGPLPVKPSAQDE